MIDRRVGDGWILRTLGRRCIHSGDLYLRAAGAFACEPGSASRSGMLFFTFPIALLTGRPTSRSSFAGFIRGAAAAGRLHRLDNS
jgi:hypothetical protein